MSDIENRQTPYLNPLNLTTHRVGHQLHMVGHDDDFHSELSGLAHSSARDLNWRQDGYQGGNQSNVMEAICDQIARKEEAHGDSFLAHL